MITTVQQKTEEDFELLPDPERIVNGLRDTGYNLIQQLPISLIIQLRQMQQKSI